MRNHFWVISFCVLLLEKFLDCNQLHSTDTHDSFCPLCSSGALMNAWWPDDVQFYNDPVWYVSNNVSLIKFIYPVRSSFPGHLREERPLLNPSLWPAQPIYFQIYQEHRSSSRNSHASYKWKWVLHTYIVFSARVVCMCKQDLLSCSGNCKQLN